MSAALDLPLSSSSIPAQADPLEQSILVTLLDQASLYPEIAEILEPGDFVNESARQIFAWLAYEIKAGRDVDNSLAMSHFANSPKLSSYFIAASVNFPTPANLKRHAEELRDLSVRLSLARQLRDATRELLSGDMPVVHELSKLDANIKGANSRMNAGEKTTSSYKDVGSLWTARFKDRAKKGGIPGLSTGFRELDALTAGLNPENFIVVGGRPSMGKTTLTMNIVENSAIKNGEPWMVFSMEMPMLDIYERSVASIAGIDFEDLRLGRLKCGDLEKLKVAQEVMDAAPLYIDDQPALSLNQVVARATKAKKNHGIKGILIDYLQLMTVSQHFKNNRNEGIGEISRGLKQLARDLGLPVIALSQLSRDLERRPNKRPINSDLRDSGSIEQDADVIMFVYRDEVYNPDTEDRGIAELIIGKQRNGPLGTVRLSFANGQSRFENLAPALGAQQSLSQVAANVIANQDRQDHSEPTVLEMSHASHSGVKRNPETGDESGTDDLPF